jgi:RNA polymerase sigma-70 factor (ECF subfamily)
MTVSPNAAAALETLCRTYWYPLYAYVRRSGHGPDDAKDLTQEFFARFAREELAACSRSGARTYSAVFLLVAMKRFLAKEWRREHAPENADQEARLFRWTPWMRKRATGVEPAVGADVLFERRWALTLLTRAMDRIANRV